MDVSLDDIMQLREDKAISKATYHRFSCAQTKFRLGFFADTNGTRDVVQYVKKLYESGEVIAAIANEINIPWKTLSNTFVKLGHPLSPTKGMGRLRLLYEQEEVTRADYEALVAADRRFQAGVYGEKEFRGSILSYARKMFDAGEPVVAIARTIDVPSSSLRTVFSKLGTPLTRARPKLRAGHEDLPTTMEYIVKDAWRVVKAGLATQYSDGWRVPVEMLQDRIGEEVPRQQLDRAALLTKPYDADNGYVYLTRQRYQVSREGIQLKLLS